jgi:hypothetical protein
MQQKHQGKLVKEWIEKNHDSINALGARAAEADEVPEKDFIKTQASAVNLMHSISKQEFLKPSWHMKWEKKLEPFTGLSLGEVLKEMEELNGASQRSNDIDYQKGYFEYKARYEELKENYEALLAKL